MGMALCWLLVAGCRTPEPPAGPAPSAPIRLTDVTAEVGLDFVHTDGSSGRRYIVEPMSAGLALFDYNGDGLIDIYFLNGAPLKGAEVEVPPRNRLYRNEGGWRFTDVTDLAGVGDLGFGLGVTAGDFDNDGYADLYLNNFGPNVLYHNNGDGTFTDVTDSAGVSNGNLVGAGAAFLDMDADGDLDLYAANYLQFDYAAHVVRTIDGIPRYPVPRDFMPVPDSLFRNDGDGTFTDVSSQSGVASHAGTGMGMVTADYDRDGDTDVFVLNDVAANFFFQNDGAGNFREVAVFNGTAYNAYGDENASMGVDCGDYDNDGWLDFLMTSYQGEMPVLYRNLGNGVFEDVVHISGAGEGAFSHVNWGNGLVDFDNDGDLDVFIANGHTEDNIDLWDDSTAYRARNLVLMNDGTGHFTNITRACGSGLLPVKSSRGAGFDDLDNDGDVDVVVLNSREEPTLARNDSPGGNHWLELRLIGIRGNRDGVGAQVDVTLGGRTRTAEVHGGRGYQSYYGAILHFGLGHRNRVARVEVRWIGGLRDTVEGIEVDQRVIVHEGSGRVIPWPPALSAAQTAR
jgi:hypothetical protein